MPKLKLHNTPRRRYLPAVPSLFSRNVLHRLRSSARLAMLVLLVFGLKLGAAAACTSHDFADLGLATAGEHGALVKASPTGNDGEPTPTPNAHTATCTHGSAHPATDLALPATSLVLMQSPVLESERDARPPNLILSSQLRPPIV